MANMATPRRRSNRLRSNTPQHTPGRLASTANLSSLEEHRESSDEKFNHALPTPAPPKTMIPQRTPSIPSTPTKSRPETPSQSRFPSVPNTPIVTGPSTPSQSQTTLPDHAEMHPSRHHNTVKKINTAKSLGIRNPASFYSVSSPTKAGDQQSSNATDDTQEFSVNPFSSPSFEFKFKRPSTEMSSEAQKMMEELRESAARNKAKILAERQQQELNETDEDNMGRKIKSARGKMGRYSDVHMQEFKKMNSIANHPSAFRADPSRIAGATKNLKRTNSKADLNNSESPLKQSPSKVELKYSESPLKRSPSKANLHNPSFLKRTPSMRSARDRDDSDSSSPAKRFKQSLSQRRLSYGSDSDFNKPHMTPSTLDRVRTGTLQSSSHILTPTKASLARSISVKSVHANPSKIPALAPAQVQSSNPAKLQPAATPQPMFFAKPLIPVRNDTEGHVTAPAQSPLKTLDVPRTIATPQPKNIIATSPTPAFITFLTPQPARTALPKPHLTGAHKIRSSFANGFSHVKSILRRPQPLYSDDPVKIAAGTHVSTPKKSSGDSKDPGTTRHRQEKHVNFNPNLVDGVFEYASHSVATSAATGVFDPEDHVMQVSESEGLYPSLAGCTPMHIAPVSAYPTLPAMAVFNTSPTRAVSEASASIPKANDFTFRADQTISFGTPVASPVRKNLFPSTIRRVRASDTSALIGKPDFEQGIETSSSTPRSKSAQPILPSTQSPVKHKRIFDEFAADTSVEEKENKRPVPAVDENEGSPKKKARMTEQYKPPPKISGKPARPTGKLTKPSPGARTGKGGFLSLARLNALAQPKKRE